MSPFTLFVSVSQSQPRLQPPSLAMLLNAFIQYLQPHQDAGRYCDVYKTHLLTVEEHIRGFCLSFRSLLCARFVPSRSPPFPHLPSLSPVAPSSQPRSIQRINRFRIRALSQNVIIDITPHDVGRRCPAIRPPSSS